MNTRKLRKIHAQVTVLKCDVDEILNEAQTQFDGMGERAQEGERGQYIKDRIDNLETALDSLDDAEDHLGKVLGL